MASVCNGICIRHKSIKQHHQTNYTAGVKRCQVCEIFMKWDDLFCPCCGFRMRTRPRTRLYKDKWHKLLLAV
jgi:RNA polymerase subunit RPABC4/transcription elongation factor Spt4